MNNNSVQKLCQVVEWSHLVEGTNQQLAHEKGNEISGNQALPS